MSPPRDHRFSRRLQQGELRRTFGILLPYLWPSDSLETKARVVTAFVLLSLSKVAGLFVPVILGQAVDMVSEEAFALPMILGLLVAYGALRVGEQLFSEGREYIFARVAQRTIRSVGVRVFDHLHSLSLRFHLDRQTGGLSRIIERGTKAIEFLLTFMLFNIVPMAIELLLVCAVLWSLYDVSFAVVTLLVITIYVAWTLIFTEFRIKLRKRMNQSDQQAHGRAVDSLLNYETVKYFGNEQHESDRFSGAMKRYEDAAVRSRTSLSVLNVGQGFIIAVGLTLVMYLAAKGIDQGHMTAGDFVTVNAYLIQLYLPLDFLGFVYREIRQSLVDMADMFGLLGQPKEVDDMPNAPPLVRKGGEVVFDHVGFSYQENRQILHDVSFVARPGETVAIVGPSGAGKSTLSRLLFRFFDVTSGEIRIDGQNISHVQQHSLRQSIGIVPQDTVLFNDTIGYNIAYGHPGSSKDAIVEAAKLASIHQFIMELPDGYDTMVGERGLKLSGGEKQRVAIARTLLKAPEIFLFDEATSALDTRTERAIQGSLRTLSEGKTTLIIAHRLSTITHADQIIVLDKGRVVEQGHHDALLAKQGLYAQMWEQQARVDNDSREVVSISHHP